MIRRIGFISLLMLVLALSACQAAATNEDAPREASGYDMGGAPAAFPTPGLAYEESKAEGEFGGDASTAPMAIERMVIRNADVSIIVDEPDDAMSAIISMAEGMNGYVVSSSLYQVYNNQGLQVPEGSIVVRVPAEKLNDALNTIARLTKNPEEDILRQNITGQDVTEAYTDAESRLKNLEDAEEQLRLIMDQANRTEDVLAVFNELTRVRGEIEQIKGQMQYYEQASALSAISVTIQAREMIAPITIAGWTPGGIARDAIQALVEAGQFLASAGIWLVLFALPVLLIIAIPVVLVVWIVRKAARGRRPRVVPTD